MKTKYCPICDSADPLTASLGKSPISGYVSQSMDDAARQPIFDATLNLCRKCNALFQDTHPLADKILYELYSQHNATIRSSEQYNHYYEEFTDNVAKCISAKKIAEPRVLEIGCNDGLLLATLGRKITSLLIGVEPSDQFFSIWADRSILGINAFFGENTALEMKQKHGLLDVIIARHVLEHIAQPHDFFNGLEILSSIDTTIYIEVPYSVSILNDFRYENVSYSHLIHYSVTSMRYICEQHGFAVRSYELVSVDGGSIVFTVQKKKTADDTSVLAPEVEKRTEDMYRSYFESFVDDKEAFVRKLSSMHDKTIIGFGAGAKGQFLIHIYELQNILSKVFDETPNFLGRYIPGTDLQICHPDFDGCDGDTVFINLAPTHARHVRSKVPSTFEMLDPIND